MKFDYIVGNPPYKKNLYMKIFMNSFRLLEKEMIFIMPFAPYINKNPKPNKFFTEFKNIIKKYKTSIEEYEDLFNGIFLTNGACITKIENKVGDTHLKYIDGNNNKIENIDNINRLRLSEEIFQKSLKFYKNIEGKKLIDIMSDKGTLKLAKIRGNIRPDGLSNDFYTFLSKNDYLKSLSGEQNKGTKSKKIDCDIKDIDNIIYYLETKFARYALALNKWDFNTTNYYYTLIPVVDFNKKWNDKMLFEYFNVPKDIQKEILKIPDWKSIID